MLSKKTKKKIKSFLSDIHYGKIQPHLVYFGDFPGKNGSFTTTTSVSNLCVIIKDDGYENSSKSENASEILLKFRSKTSLNNCMQCANEMLQMLINAMDTPSFCAIFNLFHKSEELRNYTYIVISLRAYKLLNHC